MGISWIIYICRHRWMTANDIWSQKSGNPASRALRDYIVDYQQLKWQHLVLRYFRWSSVTENEHTFFLNGGRSWRQRMGLTYRDWDWFVRISYLLIEIYIENWVRFAISTFFRLAGQAGNLIAKAYGLGKYLGLFPKSRDAFWDWLPRIMVEGVPAGGGWVHGFLGHENTSREKVIVPHYL